MKKKKIKQKFIDFLKENDALIPFCCNLAIDSFYGPISLSQLLNDQHKNHHNWTTAPIWDHTTEGWDYWDKLDYKWFILCNSM